MAITNIIRPIERDSQEWDEIQQFVTEKFRQAKNARSAEIDSDYQRWLKNYEGEPREKERSLPWVGSSNIVVPVIKIFLDTFVARSLHIIWNTRPLFMSGLPNMDDKKALEFYLNTKARKRWKMYDLTKDILHRGALSGTCFVKTLSIDKRVMGTNFLTPDSPFAQAEPLKEFVIYKGPRSKCIPFEDVYVSPLTANCLEEIEIIFHRIPYNEYQVVKDLQDLEVPSEEIEGLLKRQEEPTKVVKQNLYGTVESNLKTLNIIEVQFTWELAGNPTLMIAKFIEANSMLVDLYVLPYPPTPGIYDVYRPFPKVDSIYGRSLPGDLESIQEETSRIHNDRRNNSYIANAPVFIKKNGATFPNPSSNWYPGKVFEVDSMDDFQMQMAGRNYDPMIQDESFNLQYAERITALSAPMQGAPQGFQDKKGVYNAAGTLALLSEGNQRQDTNIADARNFLAGIGLKNFLFQVLFDNDDPDVGMLPPEYIGAVRRIFGMEYNILLTHGLTLETSSAGNNREIEKRNLLDSVGMLMQYSQQIQQYAQILLNPNLPPPMRELFTQILRMHKWLATRILNSFEITDLESIVPDVLQAFNLDTPEEEVTTTIQQTAGMQIPGGGGPQGQSAFPNPQAGGNTFLGFG